MRKCLKCKQKITHKWENNKYVLYHVYQKQAGGLWFYTKKNKNGSCNEPKEV